MKLGSGEYAVLMGLAMVFIGVMHFSPAVAFGLLAVTGSILLTWGLVATFAPWVRLIRSRDK